MFEDAKPIHGWDVSSVMDMFRIPLIGLVNTRSGSDDDDDATSVSTDRNIFYDDCEDDDADVRSAIDVGPVFNGHWRPRTTVGRGFGTNNRRCSSGSVTTRGHFLPKTRALKKERKMNNTRGVFAGEYNPIYQMSEENNKSVLGRFECGRTSATVSAKENGLFCDQELFVRATSLF